MAIKKAAVKVVEGKLVWAFDGGDTFTVDSDKFSKEVQELAMLHGLKQKLSDSYAGVKTAREAQQVFEGLLKALEQGSWTQGRSASGGIWVEALARAVKVSLEEALEKWNSMEEEKQKDLKKHAQIKLAKQELELERAQKAAEGEGPLDI